MPLTEWTEVTLLPQKVAANLLAALGLTALFLAAIGLYSVMAYSVKQRTREIGLRMALGAQPRHALGDVMGRALGLTGAGLAIGLAASMVLTRALSGILIDVGANDPATFAGTIAFLTSISLVASYLPARRAAGVEPMVALRCE